MVRYDAISPIQSSINMQKAKLNSNPDGIRDSLEKS